MLRPVFAAGTALALTLAVDARAEGGHPNGASLVRLLGEHAAVALAPASTPQTLAGLVRLPAGASAESLGLEPVVPGFARLRGTAPAIVSFSLAHPSLEVEVSPPLHTLLDEAGLWIRSSVAHLDGATGAGVLVGVADTGLDVAHPDFFDAQGNTRVAWILDLSATPYGKYPDLEKKYGYPDASGALHGAVYAGSDFAALTAAGVKLPGDQVGHGTHVTSLAAGNGGQPPHRTAYVGVAPEATILFARITRDSTDSIVNDDLVRGVQFLFDRADFMQKPIAVNLSLGSDFGPHDGTLDWEQTLASFVGPDHPGHALVAAAGNSGDITTAPGHDSVRVSPGVRMTVPILTQGAQNGALEVWIAMRAGASLSVGLDGPNGRWISPVPKGQEEGKNGTGYASGVINGSSPAQSPVPTDSQGAVVVVSGTWPPGTYAVTLEGEGTADLYLEGTGDVSIGGGAGFQTPVREGTITLPATNPGVIGVGCTINRAEWTSIDQVTESQSEPVLDAPGGLPALDPAGSFVARQIVSGEVCGFSSAGPTLTGVPKPEISAPGELVVGAMSAQALPGTLNSIFTTSCPSKNGQPPGNRCLQVDSDHAIAQGTSQSAPMVAGTIALLFQRDPTLTQDRIVGLLQAGAHMFRGAHAYDDQSGPGELDVVGALDALDQTWDPAEILPVATSSWMTVSASYLAADGSTPLTAILELRTGVNTRRADLFDVTRLRPLVSIDGAPRPPPTLVRRGPGVWSFTVQPPAGMGGRAMTLGATFDGEPIVKSKTIPIAADIWSSEYASTARGGCSIARAPGADRIGAAVRGALALLIVACAHARRRRRA